MSDQFLRHARHSHQQAAQQSADRARQWQQDMFKHQSDMRALLAAQAPGHADTPSAGASGGRWGGLVRVVVVLVLLGALSVGAFLLIRSGQLSVWLDLKDF
jgi:hypothetical protein